MESSLSVSDVLGDAVSNLLEDRGTQSHWGDIRSTALAVWALNDLLACGSAPTAALREVRTAFSDAQLWLAGQAKREEGGVSWESEAWDTALAMIALSSDEAFAERLDQATAWLLRIRGLATGAWYEEVWETTLVTVALLRAERMRKGPPARARWIEDVLHWLVGIPSKDSGEFICPHYSGFIVWVFGEIHESQLIRHLETTPVWTAFNDKVQSAVNWILESLSAKPDRLWSDYTFANAYIGYGLSIYCRYRNINTKYAAPLIEWMRMRRGSHGGFEDTEDTALAILALSSVLRNTPYEAEPLFKRISRLTSLVASPPQICFLGYSAKSNDIASPIKGFLSSKFPRLSVKDWKWDFKAGRVLFDELDCTSRACHLAVFLVTRDDTLSGASGLLTAAPRDNIVFEIGFFAARLGIQNTILIVEQGTKMPTDLGGIIYIPLKKRNALDDVYLGLDGALRTILRMEY